MQDSGIPIHHRRKRHRLRRRLLHMVLGVLFLILGVLGLFLPVLQGLLFLAIGVALLADHVPLFARLRNAVYRRWPRVDGAVQKARQRFRAMFHRHHTSSRRRHGGRS